MKPTFKIVAHEPSWVIRSDEIELAVTQTGGQMAPVTFYRDSAKPIQPYYVSPWQGEGLDIPAAVLRPLRGDFFCMPFGKDGTLNGRRYPYHGETATGKWSLAGLSREGGRTTLALTMKTPILGGSVTKELGLIDGQNVVYSCHTFHPGAGKRGQGKRGLYPVSAAETGDCPRFPAVPAGHHATLAMPYRPGSVLLSTSPIRFGVTNPVATGDPATGEYFRVRTNCRFRDLARVPLRDRDEAFGDYSRYPVGPGFVDLIAVVNQQPRGEWGLGKWGLYPAPDVRRDGGGLYPFSSESEGGKRVQSPIPATGIGYSPLSPSPLFPAWTCASVTDEGFIWFSLKDPRVLPLTMIWTENHGRHFVPWNGRNSCLGLEDICSNFALGLEASTRPNALSRAGVPTALGGEWRKRGLSPIPATGTGYSPRFPQVRYIQGVVKVPKGFGRVKTLRFAPGEVRFVSSAGRTVAAPVQHEFLVASPLGLLRGNA